MVCEEMIKQMERRLKRKLTKDEKKKVEEKMHHAEITEPYAEEAREMEVFA